MPLIALNCDNIGDLAGGEVRAMVNHALAQALADLDERGEQDGKPRDVLIKLSMHKDRGQLVTGAQVKTTVPAYQSGATMGQVHEQRARGGGMTKCLLFQDGNPENPDQPTFDHVDSGNEEE